MDSKRKEQLIIKIFSVIAAFGLWLYITNVENPTTTYKKVVPVTLINESALTQSKLKVLKDKDYSVTLTIKGMSTDVYMVSSDQFKVVADLGAYVMKKGENKIPVEVKAYPENIKVLNSDNLWIRVDVDDLVEKTVPVKIIGEAKTKDGYHAFQPIVRPTNVVISGAAQFVNNVVNVTANVESKNLDKDANLKLPLQAVDSNGSIINEVTIDPNYVDMVVPVKKVKTVGINVKTKGILSKGINVKAITPERNSIDIAGSDELINSITGLDTEPIDLSTITPTKNTVDVKLIVPNDLVLLNSTGTIRVKLDMDNDTQKTLSVDIKYKNLSDAYSATMDTNKATVTVSGLESVIANLKEEDISCYVDLSNISEGEKTLPIAINLPANVNKVLSTPQTVTVTISKKQ